MLRYVLQRTFSQIFELHASDVDASDVSYHREGYIIIGRVWVNICAACRNYGATENARPDIARLDNSAPYCKGGHRETCFSVRVDAHYKFV